MTRYRKQAGRHAMYGAIAALVAILCAAWSFAAALSDMPERSIFAACISATAVFVAVIETKESTRCLAIHFRWRRWDREKLQQPHQ